MPFKRIALMTVLVALAGCGANEPGAEQTPPAKPVQATAAQARDGALPAADAFLASLQLPASFQVTDSRAVQSRRGGPSHVFAIDYRDARVKAVDRTLATGLRAQGFKRGKVATVPGGIRVPYAAPDGRRVSTMIRNKKYLKDRIAADAAGQVSLTYVLPRARPAAAKGAQ